MARVIFIISTEKVEFKQLENWFAAQEDILKAIDNRISALIVKKTAIEADIEKQTAKITQMEAQVDEKQNLYEDIYSEIEVLKHDLKIRQQKVMQKQISCTEARQEVIRYNDKLNLLTGQAERFKAF